MTYGRSILWFRQKRPYLWQIEQYSIVGRNNSDEKTKDFIIFAREKASKPQWVTQISSSGVFQIYQAGYLQKHKKFMKNLFTIINSAKVIQSAYRKYRYNPSYKFCRKVFARRLLLDGITTEQEI